MKKIALPILGVLIVSLLAFFIFIPAFTGRLQVDPSLWIGNFEIRLYGLTLALAIFVSYFFARKNSWRFGVSKEAIDDYSFWAVIVSVLGARIYYVLFTYDYFLQNPAEIYKIWHGGLSIYGGILAGILFTYFYCKGKAFTFNQLFDLIALSLPLGQAIGRFGNFFNQEAYGSITDLPWKMYVSSDGQYHHPAFLYESILDLAVFFILYKLMGKTKSGGLGLAYLALYSFGRFFIEGIRVDSFFIRGFRVDQLVAFLLFVISSILLYRRAKN